MNAVERDCIRGAKFGIPVKDGAPTPPAAERLRHNFQFREQRALHAARIGLGRVGSALCAGVAEQFLRTLGHREQTHHSLGLTDDASTPTIKTARRATSKGKAISLVVNIMVASSSFSSLRPFPPAASVLW